MRISAECRGTILYDNTKLAVARILGGGERKKTRAFSELQSHYLFAEKFGRPGKGNDKGKVEGLVGYARRNFHGADSAGGELGGVEHASAGAVPGATRAAVAGPRRDDRGTLRARPRGAVCRCRPGAYEACEKRAARVSSLSLVRYRGNDYSVPTEYGHREVLVKGYVHEVVIVVRQ